MVDSTPPHSSRGGRERGNVLIGFFVLRKGIVGSNDFVEDCQCLGDYLVHVVVLVGGKPSDELHARRGIGERLVLLVSFGVFRARHRIIRVSLRLWVFVDQARFRMLLTGQILELGHARVYVIVGVVD